MNKHDEIIQLLAAIVKEAHQPYQEPYRITALRAHLARLDKILEVPHYDYGSVYYYEQALSRQLRR